LGAVTRRRKKGGKILFLEIVRRNPTRAATLANKGRRRNICTTRGKKRMTSAAHSCLAREKRKNKRKEKGDFF